MPLEFAKNIPYRSKRFLEFIRQKGCICGCNNQPRSHPAHQSFGMRGGGPKVPDTQAVPLHWECHHMEHNWPHHKKLGFWEEKGIDVKHEIIKLQTEYIKCLEEKLYGSD
jgi:hypothetical protein